MGPTVAETLRFDRCHIAQVPAVVIGGQVRGQSGGGRQPQAQDQGQKNGNDTGFDGVPPVAASNRDLSWYPVSAVFPVYYLTDLHPKQSAPRILPGHAGGTASAGGKKTTSTALLSDICAGCLC